MTRNVFFVVFLGTLLKPIVGAVVSIPKSTTLRNVTWLCASIQEKSWAIVVLVVHRDNCPEDSLIGRRNHLTTETANSLSAAAGPGLSKARNPIANLASD